MKIHPIISRVKGFEEYINLSDALVSKQGPVSVFGLGTPHKAHIVAGLVSDMPGNSALWVFANELDCNEAQTALSAYGVESIIFPADSLSLGLSTVAASGGTEHMRVEAMIKLLSSEKPIIALTTIKAVMQRIVPPRAMSENTFVLKTGNEINITAVLRGLVNAGYERVEMCDAPGTFAMQGGRLDIYPLTGSPCRVELFDTEIDTMRMYDPETQRSIENVSEFRIMPATQIPFTEAALEQALERLSRKPELKSILDSLIQGGSPAKRHPFLTLLYPDAVSIADYMPTGSLIILDEPPRLIESGEISYAMFCDSIQPILEENPADGFLYSLYTPPHEILPVMDTLRTCMFFAFTRTFHDIKSKSIIQLETGLPSRYTMGESHLIEDITAYKRVGTSILIYAGTHADGIHRTLSEAGLNTGVAPKLDREIVNGETLILRESLPQGSVYLSYKFVVITENELYGNRFKERKPLPAAKKSAVDRITLSSLNRGDFVVHDAHGIGRFVGVESLTVDDATKDYILLEYAHGDKLYIPTDQLDRVQKYTGSSEDAVPHLSKLGGTEWQKTVTRVRSGVRELAFDLVRLYGERQKRTGFSFSPDTPWQAQLEEAFPYDETPDQLTCIDEIKQDMESPIIMDRLLCGDVGFGKTEVALRMAFKAVMDSKQAAFLVPTTILAHQHFNTLASRFAGYPINVDFLSRFKTPAEQKETLKKLAEGRIDLIIGTHRLLSKDVKFKDLGLLVIDEEQRFGVGHKESIKEIKKTVDVLTLTATPIPRTLHMSLIGIRDVSIIETPPQQRYPVQTHVVEYSDALTREVVLNELGRGGQVYILYNDVKSIERFQEHLRNLIPEANIKYAHGQMTERQLENTMFGFIGGAFDVLLCSTIIENGLDVPNANTILVYDADKFGLAQLYQLRGRVGRSTRLGYAYLTFRRDKSLTEVAQKRLMAIKEFTQLGMGYKIALRDLQIRGAGNVLGPQQHGHMSDVGYEMYRQIMSEAVAEAKGEAPAAAYPDTIMEMPLDAYIPKSYIKREDLRLAMYKRIAAIDSDDYLMDVQDELIDRYGDMPKPVLNLLTISLIKAKAAECFITRVRMSQDGEINLIFSPNAPYDIERLMFLVRSESGAQLLNLAEPMLTIKPGAKSRRNPTDFLPQFLNALKDCLSHNAE